MLAFLVGGKGARKHIGIQHLNMNIINLRRIANNKNYLKFFLIKLSNLF